MKSIRKASYRYNIPIWAIVFCLITTIGLITSACSDPQIDRSENIARETQEKLLEREQNSDLPPEVLEAVREDIIDNYRVNSENIQVTEANTEVWPDGCLGLAKADEACSQALVDGWRVKVTDGDRTWVYRTDNRGYSLRLESQSN